MRDWMTASLEHVGERARARVAGLREPRVSDSPRGGDAESLAVLMYESYRGTVDDAGETQDDARGEVAKLIRGDFGAFEPGLSVVVERDGALASATLVTRDRTGIASGEPFVAFSMTAPTWKRQGLARAGLIRVMGGLRAVGEQRVHLVVTRANVVAVHLYESLGFVVVEHRK